MLQPAGERRQPGLVGEEEIALSLLQPTPTQPGHADEVADLHMRREGRARAGIVMQHEIDGERAGGGGEISIRTVEVG